MKGEKQLKYEAYQNNPLKIFLQGYFSYIVALGGSLIFVKLLRPKAELSTILSAFPWWYLPTFLFVILGITLYQSLYSFRTIEKEYPDDSDVVKAIDQVMKKEKAKPVKGLENEGVYKLSTFKNGFVSYVIIQREAGRILMNAPRKIIKGIDRECMGR